MWFLRTNLVIVTLLLTACATPHQDMSNLSRWKGTSMQNVITELGTPDQILHESGGHTLYVYMTHTANTFVAPEPITNPVIAIARGKTIGVPIPARPTQNNGTSKCTALFETDSHNIILKTSEQGSCNTILNLTNH
jgi:hypothetical protein